MVIRVHLDKNQLSIEFQGEISAARDPEHSLSVRVQATIVELLVNAIVLFEQKDVLGSEKMKDRRERDFVSQIFNIVADFPDKCQSVSGEVLDIYPHIDPGELFRFKNKSGLRSGLHIRVL